MRDPRLLQYSAEAGIPLAMLFAVICSSIPHQAVSKPDGKIPRRSVVSDIDSCPPFRAKHPNFLSSAVSYLAPRQLSACRTQPLITRRLGLQTHARIVEPLYATIVVIASYHLAMRALVAIAIELVVFFFLVLFLCIARPSPACTATFAVGGAVSLRACQTRRSRRGRVVIFFGQAGVGRGSGAIARELPAPVPFFVCRTDALTASSSGMMGCRPFPGVGRARFLRSERGSGWLSGAGSRRVHGCWHRRTSLGRSWAKRRLTQIAGCRG